MEPGIGLDECHHELILSETTSTRNWLRINRAFCPRFNQTVTPSPRADRVLRECVWLLASPYKPVLPPQTASAIVFGQEKVNRRLTRVSTGHGQYAGHDVGAPSGGTRGTLARSACK
jgi:hypothetical protein